jgi:hypothetical protein
VLLNAPSPNYVKLGKSNTPVIPEFLNAEFPNVVTLDRSILVKDEASTDVNEVHSLNASFPIVVTLSKLIVLKLEHS